MPYSITAETLIGALTLHRDTADGAIKKARELREGGMWNVRVADDEGVVLDDGLSPPDPDLRH
jgi:hypothetical protein